MIMKIDVILTISKSDFGVLPNTPLEFSKSLFTVLKVAHSQNFLEHVDSVFVHLSIKLVSWSRDDGKFWIICAAMELRNIDLPFCPFQVCSLMKIFTVSISSNDVVPAQEIVHHFGVPVLRNFRKGCRLNVGRFHKLQVCICLKSSLGSVCHNFILVLFLKIMLVYTISKYVVHIS